MDYIAPEIAKGKIGQPVETLKFKDYDIYIYDTDISKYIK